jgi:hypothetical protein
VIKIPSIGDYPTLELTFNSLAQLDLNPFTPRPFQRAGLMHRRLLLNK